MSAEATDGGEELVTTDCGHEVPKHRTVSVPELILCDECYTPYGVTEWPKTIGVTKHRTRDVHGTSIQIARTYLLGLDRRGRAVYYDEDARRTRVFVPKHDTAYQEDRQTARETFQTREGRLRSRKDRYSPEGPAPPSPNGFVTLPNGDHIVEVANGERLDDYGLDRYLDKRTDEWQQVHPEIVERFNVEGFGTESGKALDDYECRECGHVEEDVDPEAAGRCPTCDTHKFYPQPPEE